MTGSLPTASFSYAVEGRHRLVPLDGRPACRRFTQPDLWRRSQRFHRV